MQLNRKLSVLAHAAKSALAVSLAVVLAGLGLMAASGSLHRSFHHDQPADSNLCAVCLLAHGNVAAADVAPPVLLHHPIAIAVPLVAIDSFRSSLPFLLPPGRGPPMFDLPVVVAG